MATPVDPLAWINENPLLLTIGGPIAVSAISLAFKKARRIWWRALLFIGRKVKWLAALRLVHKDRVRPSARQLRRTDIAPVRWVIRYGTGKDGAPAAVLANSASGVARRVRIDEGNGTKVFGDGTWAEIAGEQGGRFKCWVDPLSTLANSASFRVTWTDALGETHYQWVEAHPGPLPTG